MDRPQPRRRKAPRQNQKTPPPAHGSRYGAGSEETARGRPFVQTHARIRPRIPLPRPFSAKENFKRRDAGAARTSHQGLCQAPADVLEEEQRYKMAYKL